MWCHRSKSTSNFVNDVNMSKYGITISVKYRILYKYFQLMTSPETFQRYNLIRPTCCICMHCWDNSDVTVANGILRGNTIILHLKLYCLTCLGLHSNCQCLLFTTVLHMTFCIKVLYKIKQIMYSISIVCYFLQNRVGFQRELLYNW